MPQLDFSNPLIISQIIWLLIIFGLLYYVLAAYALPRVEGVLDERRRRIEGDLDAARAAKAEADAAMAAHREATARARAEAQAAIASALQQSQGEAQARSDELAARLARQVEEADARIAAARDAAMGAIRQVAADTTGALVARLGVTARPEAVEAAVANALRTRGAAAQG
ncbi:F0F1 ATP synthase subunit B' [Falsiroseomonas sp. CW058]|uniref:F0F1 ATP synthase subunit B family protein n=1 Tax=Falsiroseomonas sp. CW058 TaxID=3388664 RepID=UPI003D321F8C